jgi:hypothetical protein
MNKRDFRNLVIGIAIGYFLMLSFLTIPNKFGWVTLAISVVFGVLFWERNRI